jgi:hypothetical protein
MPSCHGLPCRLVYIYLFIRLSTFILARSYNANSFDLLAPSVPDHSAPTAAAAAGRLRQFPAVETRLDDGDGGARGGGGI